MSEGLSNPRRPDLRLQDLLPSLLDGGFEEPLWSSFLHRLQMATGADYAALTFRPPGRPRNGTIHLHAGAAFPPEITELYRERFDEDPMPYHRLAEGRVYALDELLRAGDPAHEAYYANFLVPSGMKTMRMMRVAEPSGVNAWLAVSRREGDFDAEDDRLLADLAVYLRATLRSFAALERERYTAAVASETMRRLDFGWFSLDAGGHVIDADPQGAWLLAHSGILSRAVGGKLAARPEALAREIDTAVRALAENPRSRPRALILSREPWLDMLLAPAHSSRSISAKPDPAVIAWVHGDSWSSADRCEQLAELFVLSRSEARLALALSRGMTIKEAAVDIGLTLETARNYSKKIYAKLGARGQTDLVRFVMKSVLAMA